MTEDLPLAATTVKGATRAAMTAELLAAADAGRVRVTIGRASDFFGPGVTEGSTLGDRVFGHALAGRRADILESAARGIKLNRVESTLEGDIDQDAVLTEPLRLIATDAGGSDRRFLDVAVDQGAVQRKRIAKIHDQRLGAERQTRRIGRADRLASAAFRTG